MPGSALPARPCPFKRASRGLLLLLVTISLAACETEDVNEGRQFRIGMITNNPNGLRNVAGFKEAMQHLGYVDGENATYIATGSPVPRKQLERELRAMLEGRVDLVFTAGTPTGVVAHRVTAGTAVPVVFGVVADPIAAGVMTDLSRPGGNITGVKLSQNQGRRLELLRELMPSLRRVFVPYNPDDSAPTSAVRQLAGASTTLGVEVVTGKVRSKDAVKVLLESIPAGVDAIFLVPDSTVNPRLRDVLDAARSRGIPVSGPSTAQVEEGAFMTYGFVHRDAGAQAARIADQILRGTPAGDLPVETAEFALGVNLKTAAALGIEVSNDMLERAEVIVR